MKKIYETSHKTSLMKWSAYDVQAIKILIW